MSKNGWRQRLEALKEKLQRWQEALEESLGLTPDTVPVPIDELKNRKRSR